MLSGDYGLHGCNLRCDRGSVKPGRVWNHAGDNTMNFANAWVAPRRDFAALVCINQSGDNAFSASDEVVGALIQLHSSADAPR